MEMASTPRHPFQVAAVRVLGALPPSPIINQQLRTLLDSGSTMVRIEAYKILARNHDAAIFSKTIQEKYALDIIRSDGPPLVYASRIGLPRIAVFGASPSIRLPITWTAMNHSLMISSDKQNRNVNLFYRGPELPKPLTVLSRPDQAEIIARLGGEGPADQPRFDFTYGDVVGIIQSIIDQRHVFASMAGQPVAASFVLQEPPEFAGSLDDAPPLPTPGRPQTSEPESMGRRTGGVGIDAGHAAVTASERTPG
jgi:hypothetical protein